MALYLYRALDDRGQTRSGRLEAATFELLGDILQQRGLFLKDAHVERAKIEPAQAAEPALPELIPQTTKAVPLTVLSLFTSQFAIMLRTGLPLVDALHTLERQQSHLKFKRVIGHLTQDVRQGISLSDAFKKFPRVFDPSYMALLRAGEISGTLSLMLDRMGGYLQFQREIRSKVKSALLYPAVVMGTAVFVVAFLVMFILPTFTDMFKQFNTDLPWPTQVLLGMTNNLRAFWWVYGALTIAAGSGFWFWLQKPNHAKALDRLIIRLPVIGPLVRNIIMTRVLRTLGTLMEGGVSILEAIALSGQAAAHHVFEEIMQRMFKAASEGRGLATVLIDDPVFPFAAANMIANAELTGTLPEVVLEISKYYEQETDVALKNLFTLIEPLFVIIIGVVVGFIAMSILWPIFAMNAL